MLNKFVEDVLPELPEGYFWRITADTSPAVVINSANEAIMTSNCVTLSLRKNASFFFFNYSANIDYHNRIYVGEDLKKLQAAAETLAQNLYHKLEKANGEPQNSLAVSCVGVYPTSLKTDSSASKSSFKQSVTELFKIVSKSDSRR